MEVYYLCRASWILPQILWTHTLYFVPCLLDEYFNRWFNKWEYYITIMEKIGKKIKKLVGKFIIGFPHMWLKYFPYMGLDTFRAWFWRVWGRLRMRYPNFKDWNQLTLTRVLNNVWLSNLLNMFNKCLLWHYKEYIFY